MTGDPPRMHTFGTYELIASLATGGMSSIYLARSPGADGIVVLKRLLRDHLGDPEVVAMFQDEATLGDLLRHPNLIRQYEHGVTEGEPYIVLERLEGEDLRSIRRAIRKKGAKIPLDVALEMVVLICRGLHAAHELRGSDGHLLGVVHRDVSPHNIIVTFDGNVKVLDFGIAKSSLRRIQTRTGVLKGKVPYMAPEQIRAERVDRRADVYAVGIVLYELTVGERPYFMATPSEFALMMAVVRGDIRWPTAARKDFPQALEAIIMRALAGSPRERPATLAELEAQLEAFRDREGLRKGKEIVAAFMASEFADRIEALRKAASPEELAARIADAEKRRRAAEADDDDVETAPRGPGAAVGSSTGAQYTLSRRPLGAAVLASLSGRINESFDGNVVGRALAESKLVVLDLAGVERITSYGVREWLAMLSLCKETELWLARCSEAIVAQLSMIKGFYGHARVASVQLGFRCDACGTSMSLPFDFELDGAELASGTISPRPCSQCGAEARMDDDPGNLSFARRWLNKPLPSTVRGALTVLERDGEGAPPPLEKIVLGTETHVRIRRAPDRRARFRRLLDGIEGHLRVELRDPGALDDKGAAELARTLSSLGPEVDSITVYGATRALENALASAPRVRIASRFSAARCPGCDAPRTALVAQDTDGAAPSCGRCGSPLEILSQDEIAPPSVIAPWRARDSLPDIEPRSREGSDAEPEPRGALTKKEEPRAPVAERADDARETDKDTAARSEGSTTGKSLKRMTPLGMVAPPSGPETNARRLRPGPLAAAIGAAAALAVAIAWFGWGASRGGAVSPSAQPSSAQTSPAGTATGQLARTADPADPPEERVEKREGARWVLAVGRGASDDEALTAARSRALVLLAEAVSAALPEDVRAAGEKAPKSGGPDDTGRRFLLHLGAGATPERTDTRSITVSGQRALAVQFRVSDAVFDRAVAHWGLAQKFRGMRVVPVPPNVAEAGFLVVTAPDGCPLHVGDRIMAIGTTALSAADVPSAITASSPELRVARGDSTLVLRWSP